jgi:hypothetical protein
VTGVQTCALPIWGAHGNVVEKAAVKQKAEVKKVLVATSKRLTVKKEKTRSTGYGNYRNTHEPAETGIRAAAAK